MTQKSHARQLRDAQQKTLESQKMENRCWDDLLNIHSKCQIGLNNVVSRITALYSIDGLGAMIPNRAEVAVQLRGLAKDRDEFQQELNDIYQLHKDKIGGSDDSYLNRQALDIFESYRNWQAKYEGVLLPNVEQLIAIVAGIAQSLPNKPVQTTEQTVEAA